MNNDKLENIESKEKDLLKQELSAEGNSSLDVESLSSQATSKILKAIAAKKEKELGDSSLQNSVDEISEERKEEIKDTLGNNNIDSSNAEEMTDDQAVELSSILKEIPETEEGTSLLKQEATDLLKKGLKLEEIKEVLVDKETESTNFSEAYKKGSLRALMQK